MSKRTLKTRRHSLESKLTVVRRYESGVTAKELSLETGIYLTQVKLWIRQYQVNGAEGLSMKNGPYPPSLKAEVVMKILENRLSLHQASLDYRITRSVIEKWVSKAKLQGLSALSIENRGRPKKVMNTAQKKIPKPLSREQELLIENERLIAENAYLKKLRALVEERVARESGSVPKPSKN